MMNNLKAASMECGQCNSVADHRCLLHHVRLRGIYRRLCTSCVLKLHPGSFCPTCFDLFDPSTPYHRRVICQKCPSISHPSCIPSSVDSKTYTCPPCSSANFSFFNIKKCDENGGGEMKGIDKKAATVLLCAARIASVSMSKAMGVARAEAERRVREAAMSKKRAREALENVASLAAKEKGGKNVDGVSKGSSLVHVHGKEKGSKMSNGGDSGSLTKHNRPESKVKLGSPMVGSSAKVSLNLSSIVGKKESMGSSLMPSVTMAVKKEMENVASLNHTNTELEKGKNGLSPPPKPVEESMSPPPKSVEETMLPLSNPVEETMLPHSNPVESMLPPKDTSSSYNVEVEKDKNWLLPPSPVEGQLPTKETSYIRNMEGEKANNGLLMPKESSDLHNTQVDKANNGPKPSSSDSNKAEVEKVNNVPLPPVEESKLTSKPSNDNHSEEAEKADNSLVSPPPIEEGKLQITDSKCDMKEVDATSKWCAN